MIYESSMYRLHNLEQLWMVKQIWDSIEIEEPVALEDEPTKDKTIKSVGVDYER